VLVVDQVVVRGVLRDVVRVVVRGVLRGVVVHGVVLVVARGVVRVVVRGVALRGAVVVVVHGVVVVVPLVFHHERLVALVLDDAHGVLRGVVVHDVGLGDRRGGRGVRRGGRGVLELFHRAFPSFFQVQRGLIPRDFLREKLAQNRQLPIRCGLSRQHHPPLRALSPSRALGDLLRDFLSKPSSLSF